MYPLLVHIVTGSPECVLMIRRFVDIKGLNEYVNVQELSCGMEHINTYVLVVNVPTSAVDIKARIQQNRYSI